MSPLRDSEEGEKGTDPESGSTQEPRRRGERMKRPSVEIEDSGAGEGSSLAAEEERSKKRRGEEVVEAADLGEDLVFEVLKRADAQTLARAACVSRRWRRLAEDERLWEAVCTPHYASIGCGNQQLRSVVLALGGFRRLHSLHMVPLRSPLGRAPPLPLPFGPSAAARRSQRWGRDEVLLSLSLLSIHFFEKMNRNFKSGGGGS